MKPQDIIFFFLVLFLLWKQNSTYAAGLGFICLVIAMPLFYFWIFFTAQRLTWYAFGFFILAVIFHILALRRTK